MNKKVYAVSDLHGCGNVTNKILNYLNPDDTLYFLGDAIDRGPDGVEVLQMLLEDPRVIFLKGNHEELMEDALPYIIKEMKNINYYGGNMYEHWYDNGGKPTRDSLWNLTIKEIEEIQKTIEYLPLKATYYSPLGHKVILEHAGYTPGPQWRKHNPLWDREHFHDKWNYKFKDNTFELCNDLDNFNNTYLVHGHTPVQYLRFMSGYINQTPLTKEEMKIKHTWYLNEVKYKPEVIRYCDGHKFDIDMCTVASGRAALLDLDTFEVTYIDED